MKNIKSKKEIWIKVSIDSANSHINRIFSLSTRLKFEIILKRLVLSFTRRDNNSYNLILEKLKLYILKIKIFIQFNKV